MKTLVYLKKLQWDIIDGIDSGVNTEEESKEVSEALYELENTISRMNNLYNESPNYIRLIKLQLVQGAPPTYQVDNSSFHPDVFDYKFIHKKDEKILNKVLKNSKTHFEWYHKKYGYWQRGKDFIETYDDRLSYRIKNFN